jgi:hypothetical protein
LAVDEKRVQTCAAQLSFLFWSHKHEIVNYFTVEMPKKKIWAKFQRIIELFTQKIVTKLSKIWVGIRDPGKTYSRSRIQGSKRHRIPDPQHWCEPLFELKEKSAKMNMSQAAFRRRFQGHRWLQKKQHLNNYFFQQKKQKFVYPHHRT